MLFRLTNSLTVFMDLMNRVFKPYLDKFLVVFIDHVLVYSGAPKEHAYRLREVLEVLRKHELYAKLKKFKFWLGEVAFLGRIVLKEGFSMDPQKIKAVTQ